MPTVDVWAAEEIAEVSSRSKGLNFNSGKTEIILQELISHFYLIQIDFCFKISKQLIKENSETFSDRE